MKDTNVNKTKINENWRKLNVLAIFILLNLFIVSISYSQSFLSASGTKIVNTSGTEVLLKGVNLGGWVLQEGWMISNDGNNPGTQAEMKKILYNQGQTEAQIEAYYQSWRNNFITKADVDFIKSKGMNCIRFPMHYELFLTAAQRSVRNSVIWDKSKYNNYKTQMATWVAANTVATDYTVEGYRLIDNLLSWCAANNIYVILDMHAVPGSQGTDEHIADCLSLPNDLWYSTVNQDVLNAIWKNISLRYKNNATIAMYDVINEPNNAVVSGMKTMFQRLITTIRNNGDDHLIMIEGNGWGNNYISNQPDQFSPRTNLVYNIHRYGAQTTTTATMSDPNQIQELGNAQNFRNQYQVPIFCGETGLNSLAWMRDNIVALNTVKIGWCMWSYKQHTDWNNWGFGRIPGEYPGVGVSAMASVLENIKFANMVQNPDPAYWAALLASPPVPVPVTGVTVSPANATGTSNGNIQLTANILPANATDKTVSWTSSNTAIAVVNSNGLVSGNASGTVTITAKTTDGNKTASSTVTLTAPIQTPYNGVITIPGFIEAENFDLGGEGLAYHDNDVVNQGGKGRTTEGVDMELCDWGGFNIGYAVPGEWMEYTVNVATTGIYDVKIQAACGDVTGGSLRIEFNNVDKTGAISIPGTGGWQAYQDITKTGISLTAGQQIMKIYTISSSYNLNNITFTSGTTIIPVTGVTLAPTSLSIATGATSTLTPTVAPSNASNTGVSYKSSNTAIATVNATGVVTGVAAGTATITVNTVDGNKTATCAVTVTSPNIPVTGVTLVPTTLSIISGTISTLTTTIAPANATNKAVSYTSSNTAIATVSVTGVVTGVAPGTATITVTSVDGNKTATCAVTVTNTTIAVTGVTMTPTTLSLAVNATSTLTTSVAPANATNKAVSYTSSNTAIATVSAAGVVTGVAAGTATINVSTTDGNKTATCAVTVTAPVYPSIPAQIESENYIAMSGVQKETCSEGGLNVGYTADGSWMDYGVNVTTAGSYNIAFRVANGWSANGVFQLLSGSTVLCSITVPSTGGYQTYTTINGTANLSVGSQILRVKVITSPVAFNWINFTLNTTPIPVTGVTLAPATLSLNTAATSTLTATVAPSNATNKAVTYTSSNSAIATVSTTGLVTAKAIGTATITVKTASGNKTATCTVTVTNATVAVTGVTMTPTTLSLAVNATSTLSATVAPSNATNKAVTYTSSNTAIATVSATGLVTAKAIGTATITVKTTSGNKTATCAVTVTNGCNFVQKIEAENYNEKSATPQSEACSDLGGGLDMGWIGSNDWFIYNVTIPCAGTYTIEYRIASLNSSGTIKLEKDAGAILLGTTNFTSTGGWQNWTTISSTVTLPAGTYGLGINAGNGGFNMNWITITSGSSAKSVQLISQNEVSPSNLDAQDQLKSEISVYPNPAAHGIFNIAISGFEKLEEVSTQIFNINGQMVYTNQYTVNEDGTQNIEISNINFDAGAYIIKVLGKNSVKQTRLMIRK